MPEAQARKGDDDRPEDKKSGKDGDPKSADKSPEDPAKRPEDRGQAKPPEGDKGDPARGTDPGWDPNLPPEFRKVMSQPEIDKVPAEYRDMVIRYQKWIREHSRESTR